MTKKMKSLQQFFDQASNRPLAFSEQQLRDLLAQHDAGPGQTDSPIPANRFGSNAWRLLGIGLVIAAIGTLTIDRSEDTAERTGSVAETSTVASPSPGVQVTKERVPSDAVELSATEPPASATASSSDVSTPRLTPSSPTAASSGASRMDARRAAAERAPRAASTVVSSASVPSVSALPVGATAMLDVASDDLKGLGLRRLADGRTAYGYYLISALPTDLAPNMKLDPAALLGRGYEDSLLVQTISSRGRSDLFMSRADFPLSIVTRRSSPVAHSWQIITDASGRLLEERVSVADGDQLRYVSELYARGSSDTELARSLGSVRGLDALGQSLRLNTLLPIRVSLGREAEQGVFWCRPDPQLIAALPARTVAQLRSELMRAASVVGTRDTVAIVRRGWALALLETIDSIRPETLPLDSELDVVAHGMTGAEIFAGSRRNAGSVVRFELLKNPATARASFALELDQPRRITVTLHDVNGRRLRTLVQTETREEGSGEITASLDGIDRGLYLVAVSTDKREQVVHRLVVE